MDSRVNRTFHCGGGNVLAAALNLPNFIPPPYCPVVPFLTASPPHPLWLGLKSSSQLYLFDLYPSSFHFARFCFIFLRLHPSHAHIQSSRGPIFLGAFFRLFLLFSPVSSYFFEAKFPLPPPPFCCCLTARWRGI